MLAGAVKDAAAKSIVEQVVRKDKRVRSLRNELRAGEGGSRARTTRLGPGPEGHPDG